MVILQTPAQASPQAGRPTPCCFTFVSLILMFEFDLLKGIFAFIDGNTISFVFEYGITRPSPWT
jgi:hypothetical protein